MSKPHCEEVKTQTGGSKMNFPSVTAIWIWTEHHILWANRAKDDFGRQREPCCPGGKGARYSPSTKAWTALSTLLSNCCSTITISLLLLFGTIDRTALIWKGKKKKEDNNIWVSHTPLDNKVSLCQCMFTYKRMLYTRSLQIYTKLAVWSNAHPLPTWPV